MFREGRLAKQEGRRLGGAWDVPFPRNRFFVLLSIPCEVGRCIRGILWVYISDELFREYQLTHAATHLCVAIVSCGWMDTSYPAVRGERKFVVVLLVLYDNFYRQFFLFPVLSICRIVLRVQVRSSVILFSWVFDRISNLPRGSGRCGVKIRKRAATFVK